MTNDPWDIAWYLWAHKILDVFQLTEVMYVGRYVDTIPHNTYPPDES